MVASKIYREVSECRICGQPLTEKCFSLGNQLLAGYTDGQSQPLRAPLDVMLCRCGLAQLGHSVDEAVLYRQYFYKSSMNLTMRNHLHDLAKHAEIEASLQPGEIIVDVGCNDGTLFEGYSVENITKVGYDLAENMMKEARVRAGWGSSVFNEPFTADAYNRAFDARAKIITAVAMFYDLNDPVAFCNSIKDVLAPDGLALIQMNDLYSMVKNNAFDMISHEHVCYYSMKVVTELMDSCGLRVDDYAHFDLNGGTVRLFVRHADYLTSHPWNGIKHRIRFENHTIGKLDGLARNISTAAHAVHKFVEDEVESGGRVYVYGASTRGNVILQAADLDGRLIAGAAEIHEDKIGKKIAGLDIPIVSEEEARKKATAFLVLPYSYKEEFIEREKEFLRLGGKMVFPLPELEIVTQSGSSLRHQYWLGL